MSVESSDAALGETAANEFEVVQPPAEEAAPATSRVDIGERINTIIRNAEGVADEILAEAQLEANEIRDRSEASAKARLEQTMRDTQRVRDEANAYAQQTRSSADSLLAEKRREAEAEASRIIGEAELEARSIKQAAADEATQMEADMRTWLAQVHDETSGIEARLERQIQGLREIGSQLAELRRREQAHNGESLVGALTIDHDRFGSTESVPSE